MTASESETSRDRTVRLALAAGRANLVVHAARQHVAGHRHDGDPCELCAALARYDDTRPREVT